MQRGILSKPWELRSMAKAFDTAMKSVFSGYVDPNRPPAMIVWSGLRDDPKSEYLYDDSGFDMPESVPKSESESYIKGTRSLNEWAINYATRFFYENISNHPLYRPLGYAYGLIFDRLLSIQLGKTSALMHQVRQAADSQDQFREALFTGLFKHDQTLLNQLISKSGIEAQNIVDLAILLGKQDSALNLYDQFEILAKMFRKEQSQFQRFISRIMTSIMYGGINNHPGIVEIIFLIPFATGLTVVGLDSTAGYSNLEITLPRFLQAFSLTVTASAFAIAHEAIHEYSRSDHYAGLIPIEVHQKGRF